MFIHICKNIDLGFSENVVNPKYIYIYINVYTTGENNDRPQNLGLP
jgi:hypothetical protein